MGGGTSQPQGQPPQGQPPQGQPQGGSFGDILAQRRMQQGQPQGGMPGKGGMPGAPTASPQTQAQYQQGFAGQMGSPQGLDALQNAHSQFQNSAPPQPNPMFGEQPDPAAAAQMTSNVLDSYMGAAQPAPQAQGTSYQDYLTQQQNAMQQQMQNAMAPQAPPAPPPPMPASQAPMMPQAPYYSPVGQEDPRMQAMRSMQQFSGNPEFSRSAYTYNK